MNTLGSAANTFDAGQLYLNLPNSSYVAEVAIDGDKLVELKLPTLFSSSDCTGQQYTSLGPLERLNPIRFLIVDSATGIYGLVDPKDEEISIGSRLDVLNGTQSTCTVLPAAMTTVNKRTPFMLESEFNDFVANTFPKPWHLEGFEK